MNTPEENKKAGGKRRQHNLAWLATALMGYDECPICGAAKSKLTRAHVVGHGLSLRQFAKLYGPDYKRKVEAAAADPEALQKIAGILTEDENFTKRLATDVEDALFNGPLRNALRDSVVAIMLTQAGRHPIALKRLKEINEELNQRWRLTQGGANGAPTETKDLVNMSYAIQAEVKSIEDFVARTVKLAIDESKGRDDTRIIDALPRYTGEAEKLPVPTSLTAEHRATIRDLLVGLTESIDKEAKARAIETTATAPVTIPASPILEGKAAPEVKELQEPVTEDQRYQIPEPPSIEGF